MGLPRLCGMSHGLKFTHLRIVLSVTIERSPIAKVMLYQDLVRLYLLCGVLQYLPQTLAPLADSFPSMTCQQEVLNQPHQRGWLD